MTLYHTTVNLERREGAMLDGPLYEPLTLIAKNNGFHAYYLMFHAGVGPALEALDGKPMHECVAALAKLSDQLLDAGFTIAQVTMRSSETLRKGI